MNNPVDSSASLVKPGLLVLVALSALQPFALNVMAPALPGMADALNVDYATIQLTLTFYLVAVAVAQFFGGPLSDRFGRRPVILGSLALFVLGSLAAVFSQSVTDLIGARILQACGAGTAFALARAVIRDTSGRDESASRIGYVTMVMVVVPMIAPLCGGLLDERFGWRSIFVTGTLFGLVVLAFASLRLPETRATHGVGGGGLRHMFAAFPTLIRDRRFLGYAGALAFCSASFFGFLAAAPYVVVTTMGRAPDVYGAFFVLSAFGYMVGNFVSGRFGQRIGTDRMVLYGSLISSAAIAIELIVIATLPWTPSSFFIPLMGNAIGNGLTMPGATAGALSVRPDLAGSAAGFAGGFQLGLGALMTVIASHGVEIWPPSIAFIMLGCAVTGLIVHGWGRKKQVSA
jgi:MFS transporter, DHA1 family, multidrug resistance protein